MACQVRRASENPRVVCSAPGHGERRVIPRRLECFRDEGVIERAKPDFYMASNPVPLKLVK